MATIPVTVMVRSDGIDVNPTYANVRNGSEDVQLRWIAIGGTFPEADFFWWKNSPVGAPAVSRVSASVMESATYKNDASEQRVWAYAVKIVKPDDTDATIDPEINNEPPTG